MTTWAQRFHLGELLQRLQRKGKPDGDDLPIRPWPGPAGGSTATRIAGFDTALVWCVVALLSLGLVMVYSASVALPDSPKPFYQRNRLLAALLGVKLALRHNPPADALAVQIYDGLWRWAHLFQEPALQGCLDLRGECLELGATDRAAMLALFHLPLGCLAPHQTKRGEVSSEPPVPLYLGLRPEVLVCEAVTLWAEQSHRKLGGELCMRQLAEHARRRVGSVIHPAWLAPALAAYADPAQPKVSPVLLPEPLSEQVMALKSELPRVAPPWAVRALWLVSQEREDIGRGLQRLAQALGERPCPWSTVLSGALIGLGSPVEQLLHQAQLRLSEMAHLETVLNLPARPDGPAPRPELQVLLHELLA